MKNAANIQLGVKRQETKLPLESNFISNSCMLVIRKKKKKRLERNTLCLFQESGFMDGFNFFFPFFHIFQIFI